VPAVAVRPVPSALALKLASVVPFDKLVSELCSNDITDFSVPIAVSCVLSLVVFELRVSVWPATFALTIAVTSEFTSIVDFVEPLTIDCAACWTALFGSTVDPEVVATVVINTPVVTRCDRRE
jgi:hypothetical protein